jgi:hypothetical protein
LGFIQQNSESNFFFDEVPVGISGLTTRDLKSLSSTVPAGKYLWIACQSDHPPNKKHLSGKFEDGLIFQKLPFCTFVKQQLLFL